MAHAYTPGLRVTRQAEILKERILPLKGNVVVKVGDKVKADTIIAKADLPGDVTIVNVMGLLGIEPDEVAEHMIRKPGETIAKDEIIAEARPLLPFLKFMAGKVKSPIDGTVEKVNNITGQVYLREAPQPVIVRAYIEGTVTEVIPEEGVRIKTNATFIQGIFGVGGETNGVIMMAVDSPSIELKPEFIKPAGENEAKVDTKDGVKGGDPIRVIREPNFGKLGVVKGLIPELMVMESETKVRVMEVTLADGRDIIVPRANVEIIED
jgi:hypothetical protein